LTLIYLLLLRLDHGRDDRDQIGLAEVARPDILLAGGRLLREVEPYGPRRDVGIEPPLGDLLLKAIDVKLPHPRGEGFPAARDLGLGLGVLGDLDIAIDRMLEPVGDIAQEGGRLCAEKAPSR